MVVVLGGQSSGTWVARAVTCRVWTASETPLVAWLYPIGRQRPSVRSNLFQDVLHVAVVADLLQTLQVRSELSHFVEVVRITAKCDPDAGIDAVLDELGLWPVVVKIHFRGNSVFLQDPDDGFE